MASHLASEIDYLFVTEPGKDWELCVLSANTNEFMRSTDCYKGGVAFSVSSLLLRKDLEMARVHSYIHTSAWEGRVLIGNPAAPALIGGHSIRTTRQKQHAMVVKAKIITVKEQEPEQPNKEADVIHLSNSYTTRPYTQSSNKFIAGALCDAAESFIASFIDPPVLPPRSDPKIQLADNFAPVSEEFAPQPCTEVTGEIPACLEGGIYIRNGANPVHKPVGGYYYFDGHGMLHAVKFIKGVPHYCCRYTKTSRYVQDTAAGRSLFPNPLGDMNGIPGIARIGLHAMRVALGVVDLKDGAGTANAGLVYHNGRLLAMSEDDMPYAVRICEDGDLETVSRWGFNGDAKLDRPMTAHPKLDPETGELFCYSYSVISRPYLKYFSVSSDGFKRPDVPIPLPEPVLLHDFAVTENYVVFLENQLVFRLQDLFLKRKSAIVCDEKKVPRLGVLPRYAKDSSQMKWFEVPGFTSFHCTNGWEEESGDRIVLLASRVFPLSSIFDDPVSIRNTVTEIHLDLKAGLVTQKRVSSAVLDFGQINHRFTGRKMRYAYLAIYGPWPKFSGIAKLDLAAPRCSDAAEPVFSDADFDQDPAIVAWRKFGTGRFGSEPFFVPRNSSGTPGAEEEDDGFVLCYVHDEITGVSELLIMDARSPKLETVASIKLPSRVPYGFHGLFVSKEQLAQQDPSSFT